ncbi:hypothetical protein D3C77_772480 [compost metagenome]
MGLLVVGHKAEEKPPEPGLAQARFELPGKAVQAIVFIQRQPAVTWYPGGYPVSGLAEQQHVVQGNAEQRHLAGRQ